MEVVRGTAAPHAYQQVSEMFLHLCGPSNATHTCDHQRQSIKLHMAFTCLHPAAQAHAAGRVVLD